MVKPSKRTYSPYSVDAARLLGLLIHNARIERGLTVENLADRAGVSRGLVHRAEAGDMGCTIGAVFELATIVGVSLFTPQASKATMAGHIRDQEKTLSLLPSSVHRSRTAVNDDF